MTRRRLAAIASLLTVLVVVAVVVVRARERAAAPPDALPVSTSSLLVLTWAPSLCTVETSASGCRSGRVAEFGRSFVLHGLWPQPRSQQYCDVPKDDAVRKGQPLPLPDELANRLNAMMSDADHMARHEWHAHGTCSGVSVAEYFSTATRLADEAIAILDPVFDRAAGRELTARAVREAVDAGSGPGAGARVALVCRGAQGARPTVYEVRLSLPTVAQLSSDDLSLAPALAAGPPVSPGCGQARVP